jgi:hypothetical protein
MKLNRFSEARQDQIEQLIAYAELLGLSGRDLVAIGGKLDREQSKSKKIANMEIVRSFECLPIGKDHSLDNRFKLKTLNGAYNFECVDGWTTWQVTSLKTKVTQTHSSGMWNYQLPKSSYQKLSKYSLLLDIAAGKIPLNF